MFYSTVLCYWFTRVSALFLGVPKPCLHKHPTHIWLYFSNAICAYSDVSPRVPKATLSQGSVQWMSERVNGKQLHLSCPLLLLAVSHPTLPVCACVCTHVLLLHLALQFGFSFQEIHPDLSHDMSLGARRHEHDLARRELLQPSFLLSCSKRNGWRLPYPASSPQRF